MLGIPGRTPKRVPTSSLGVITVSAIVVLAAFGGSRPDSVDDLDGLPSAPPPGLSVDERPLERLDVVGRTHVENWVERFSTRDRRTSQMYLARLGAYEGLIADRIALRGLPASLLYVPVIESALSVTARSSADAVGLWQLRPETARELGLRVDEWVDERRDPARATDAALDYLEQLRRRFGSWELALIGYNAGPSRVASRLRWYARSGDDAAARYAAVISSLPRETREYVPKLMATRILAESLADRFVFDRAEVYAYDEVLVPPRTSLWRVAEAHGSTLSELRALNPHLLKYTTPPDIAYPVRVPVGTSANVVAVLRGQALPPGEPRV